MEPTMCIAEAKRRCMALIGRLPKFGHEVLVLREGNAEYWLVHEAAKQPYRIRVFEHPNIIERQV